MNPAQRARLLLGTDEPVPAPLHLRAGPLTAVLQGSRLGPICVDGHEAWHAVDWLYRDADWGTPPCKVQVVRHHQEADAFTVQLRGHVDVGCGLDWQVSIAGCAQGLRIDARATARGSLPTNRTGLVLLHADALAGEPVTVVHTDGRTSASRFPIHVAPWPPFTLVRAIRHCLPHGGQVSASLGGADFELEDQRNNADASFKTYSRSNLMPRPYLLQAGQVVHQWVDLRIDRLPDRPHVSPARPVLVRPGEGQPVPLPRLGTALRVQDTRIADLLLPHLALLRPARLHLVLAEPDALPQAQGLARLLQAGGSQLRMDVEQVPGTPAAAAARLEDLARCLASADVVPATVAVFPSGPVQAQAARAVFGGSRIAGGTPHWFTQLNRAEDLGPLDALSFTTSALVHGAQEDTIMAGLASLPAMLATLQACHGRLPVEVGPSAIAARRSPLGAQPASDGTRRLALAAEDPRTGALFGAAWALGMLARLAQAGAHALTLFGLCGPSGLLARDGTRTPAFHLLSALAGARQMLPLHVSDPGALAALHIDGTGGHRLLLANLGSQTLPVHITAPGSGAAWLMDAQSLHPAAAAPWRAMPLRGGNLLLPAWAVARIDG